MVDKAAPDEAQGRAAAIEAFESIGREDWERIVEALESEASPATADWRDLGSERTPAEVLEQLARVKVAVPGNNQQVHKHHHNRTVENHIKLALEVAGSKPHLETFLEIVKARLESRPGPQQELLARQALLLWAPAAEIIGDYRTKIDLENLSFPILYPQETRKIEKTYEFLGGEEAIDAAAEEYGSFVRSLLESEVPGLTGHLTVQSRRKSYYNIWRRFMKEGRPDYRLPDFFGVRAIVDSGIGEPEAVKYCYAAAGVLGELFEPAPQWQRDYITRPKPNGYHSIHLDLEEGESRLEVQIRTSDMHRRAESDADTSHMAYEAWTKITPGRLFQPGLAKPPAVVRWRDETAERIRTSDDGSLVGHRPDRVLAFTPDGNLYEMAASDTLLDFAFAVHDRRALRTERIVVNGSQAAFDSAVRMGDCVEIAYDRELRWTDDWSGKVQSDRARKRLRRAHREKHAEAFRQVAVTDVEGVFERLGIDNPLNILTDKDERRLARKYAAQDFDMVLQKIGAGEEAPGRVINQVQRRLEQQQGEPPETATDLFEQVSGVREEASEVAITGIHGCEYHLAGCCAPTPGTSEIMAAASQRRGALTIHRADCGQLDRERAFVCSWTEPTREGDQATAAD